MPHYQIYSTGSELHNIIGSEGLKVGTLATLLKLTLFMNGISRSFQGHLIGTSLRVETLSKVGLLTSSVAVGQ